MQFLFNQLTDAIHWILQNNYEVHHLLHYLDDFLTPGAADSNTCYLNLSAIKLLCQTTGQGRKVEGLTTCLTFLGIGLDTVSMEVSISVERSTSLPIIAIYLFSPKIYKEATFIPYWQTFLCLQGGTSWPDFLIDLSCSVTRLHNHIHMHNQ